MFEVKPNHLKRKVKSGLSKLTDKFHNDCTSSLTDISKIRGSPQFFKKNNKILQCSSTNDLQKCETDNESEKLKTR